MRRVKAVVFDLDDTLVNWRAAEAKAIAGLATSHFAPLGVAAAAVRTTYDEVMLENVRSWAQLRRWWYVHERLQMLSERLGTQDRLPGTLLAEAFARDVSTHLALLEGAIEAVRAARGAAAAGTPQRATAILTNGRPESQRPKVHAFNLHNEVDFVGITGELGHWKPEPEAFLAVLRRLGVAPQDALMVGDSIDFDIVPAKALGMQTAWVRAPGPVAFGLTAHDAHASADVVLPTPGHLVAHLPALPEPRPLPASSASSGSAGSAQRASQKQAS